MDYPIKYRFTDEYFQDEERCGFMISECMKRYWAASLHSLEIFDDICRRHGLKYWAACGTMLGTIRHKGFIPWDDDLDIGMLREDFNAFLRIAHDELPSEYSVSFRDDPPRHSYNGVAVVNSLRAVSFDEKILNEYYYCPFPVGFDLYPYDYVPNDGNERDIWRGDYLKTLLAFKYLDEGSGADDDACNAFSNLGFDPVYVWDNKDEVRDKLLEMAEKIAGRNTVGCGPYVNRLIFLAMHNSYLPLKKEWYQDIVELPFETGSIPALRNIEDAVQTTFGANWVTPVQGTMSHNYPIYKRDIRYMIGFLEKGGLKLSYLPPQLQYIVREADRLGIEHS
jgi:lipopolysaccharide cholinephosphotransferase